MIQTVAAGQTVALDGKLAANHALVGDSGSPSKPVGAFIIVHTRAFNRGTIGLAAGPGGHYLDGATGATLVGEPVASNFVGLAGNALQFEPASQLRDQAVF